MHDRSPSPVLRYGAAALAVVLATAARLWLTPGLGPEQLPFITYFPALVFAAWFGGLGPALLTVGLGSLAAAYFFIPPQGTLLISGPVGGTSLVVFLLVGAATALLSQSMRAAERRAAAHARDAAAQRERLRVTLASIGDGVLVTDAEGRVVSLNAVAEALTGWETSAARGRPLAEVFRIVNEQTRRPAEDPVAKVLSEGVVIGLGNHTVLVARDGTERPVEDSAAPIRDADGRLLGVVLVFRDDTQRRRAEHERERLLEQERAAREKAETAERRLAFLAEASGTLTSSLEPSAVLASVLRMARQLLDADAYGIWKYDAAAARWQVAAAEGLSEEYQRASAEVLAREPAVPESPLIAADVSQVPSLAARQELYRAEGIRSLLLVPLRSRGRAEGTLAFYHRRPHAFDEVEVAVASALANLAASALDSAALYERQARLRAEAQRQREELRVTLASIGDGVLTTDVEGRVTSLNPVAEALTGWPAAEAAGRPFVEVFRIVNEQTRRPAEDPVGRVLREGVVVGLGNHTVLVARDGTERPVEDSAAPIRDAEGNLLGVVLVFRDVTEQRRAEQTHAHLAAIVESSDDAIFSKTLDGTLTSWNAGAERLYGYAAAEVIGRPVSMLVPPERAAELEGIMAAIRRGERADHIETLRRRKDGTLVDVSVTVSPVRDADGELTGASATARDITPQKRAAEALRESEERFRQLAENIHDVFWVGEPQSRRVLYVSPAYEEIWGRRAEDLYADFTEWLAAVHPDDRGRVERAFFGKILEGGYDEEYRIVRPDGSVRWVRGRGFPILPGGGEVRRVVGTAEDITERKRAEEELRQHEARLRLALDAGRMGSWEWDIISGAVAWSPGLEAIHGLEPGTFPGTFEAFQRDIHPGDREQVLGAIERAVGRGEDFRVEYRIVLPDGALRWVEGRGRLFRDESGAPARMVGVCADVTERKNAERTARFLADASAALADLVDCKSTLQKVARLAVPGFADWCAVDIAGPGGTLSRLAVAHADPEKVRLAREIAERYPPDPCASRGAYQVLRSGRSEILGDIPDEVLAAAARDAGHLRTLRELGLRSYMCVPLRVWGKVLGVITFAAAESGRRYGPADLALAEELASRAAIAIENARLYEELREADRRKDIFLAMLAHELRNPLAPLRAGLQVLRSPAAEPDAARRAGEIMERQVQHLVRLVDDLLDVSRIMRGKIELRRERVELATVVARAAETVQPLIDAHGHALRVALPEGPVWLDADPVRLAQVFANLLTNAAKYTEPGGRIDLTAERVPPEGGSAGGVVVRVCDNGIGIPPEMLSRVFELFTQARPADARSQGGLGIGLTLVKTLAEMHGGSVEVKSEGPGRGSEFSVRLPVAPPPAAGEAPPAAEPRRPRQAGRRILLVDDNTDAATSLALLLRLEGHDVRIAHDGPSALEAAEVSPPEVILLDIGMPGMDGYEVARRLRQRPCLNGAVLVALTGWGQAEDRRRSREAGFDHHLTKPVEPDTLLGLLEERQD